jgi:hypothetical protein
MGGAGCGLSTALRRVSATPGEDDSHAGRRTVSIDPLTVHELKAHKARQAAERLVIESDWPDSDLVFRTAFGAPSSPTRPRNCCRS